MMGEKRGMITSMPDDLRAAMAERKVTGLLAIPPRNDTYVILSYAFLFLICIYPLCYQTHKKNGIITN